MTKHLALVLTTIFAAAVAACSPAPAAAPPRPAAQPSPPPAAAPTTKGDTTMATTETATLGGGCFWCIEAVLERLRGVDKVVSGYSGGKVANPTYEQVSSGTTGHAESVQVTFDPQVISYHDLLEIFFAMHDPTTLNRQGADTGTQYRSVIFYRSPEQKKVAEDVIAELTRQKTFDNPIVTQVVPFEQFYPAEDYHQQYYDRNSGQGYCRVVISPKVAKLREHYLSRLKDPNK